jgi:hypothetical protein
MADKLVHGHLIKAWTQEGDPGPTLYVEGCFATNGPLQIVRLREKIIQEINGDSLLLLFHRDIFDPEGCLVQKLEPYMMRRNFLPYKKVIILSSKAELVLPIEHRLLPKKKKSCPSFLFNSKAVT